MPINEQSAEMLELLGFSTGINHDSRALSLLRAMLKKCDETGKPISFTTAYEALLREEPSASPSKAWIHKVLKSLVDDGLVTVFGERVHRKSYLADAKSVMNGIEVLRQKAIERISETIDTKKQELETIRNLDSAALAQEITEWITGRKQALRARFIKGIDEFYRVIDTTLYKSLKAGDVLRICILTINPFIHRFEKRIGKMINIAKKGVEVKFAVPASLLKKNSLKNDHELRELIKRGLSSLITLREQGHKIDARFFNISKKHYQFVAANQDSMALMITEQPIAGAWMSRRFNADLVDSAIESFDEIWNKSKSVLDIRPSDIESFGIDTNSKIGMAFLKGGKES